MSIKILFVAGMALGAGTIALAQDDFDFSQIPGLPHEPAVQLDLNPTLLGLASATTRAEHPAAANLLSSLDGVRVRVYRTLEDIDDVVGYIDEASDQLERADWQQVVRVHDEHEVSVYMQGDEESVTGLTVMIVGDEKAVFINIAGSISPQQLAQVAALAGAGEILVSLGELTAAN